jgi:hypothetical protein
MMPGEQDNNQESNKRVLPRSEADFNMLMTDTVWGSPYINKELKDKIARYYMVTNSKTGQQEVKKENMWGLLNFYTRDMRLANLDGGELHYCRYYLDLAGDFLQVDMIEPFLITLSRVASVLETSQSKKGFLRKRMNTITSESYNSDFEPKKKTLFGKNSGGGER